MKDINPDKALLEFEQLEALRGVRDTSSLLEDSSLSAALRAELRLALIDFKERLRAAEAGLKAIKRAEGKD